MNQVDTTIKPEAETAQPRDLAARPQGRPLQGELERLVSEASRHLETYRDRLVKARRAYQVTRATMIADQDVAMHDLEMKGQAELRRLDARHRQDMNDLLRQVEGLSALQDSVGDPGR